MEINILLQKAIDEIVHVLKLHGGILFLYDKNNNHIFTKTMAKSIYSQAALNILKVDNLLDKLKVSIDRKDNLVVDTILNKKINFSTNLSDFTVGVLDNKLVNIIQLATQTGSVIVVPVIFKNETIGAILLSKRASNSSFDEELPLIELFTTQIGIAIINAQLFTDTKNQLITLTKQNQDLTSPLMSTNLSSPKK
jgi:GAF domain-containing protein